MRQTAAWWYLEFFLRFRVATFRCALSRTWKIPNDESSPGRPSRGIGDFFQNLFDHLRGFHFLARRRHDKQHETVQHAPVLARRLPRSGVIVLTVRLIFFHGCSQRNAVIQEQLRMRQRLPQDSAISAKLHRIYNDICVNNRTIGRPDGKVD